mmetsp:Transcript_13241/g.24810  ORF Transcript_13241/g.24810 Transcript_13241/m.24810 type:complete len:325 (-) Transcript_13241:831-1805(-)
MVVTISSMERSCTDFATVTENPVDPSSFCITGSQFNIVPKPERKPLPTLTPIKVQRRINRSQKSVTPSLQRTASTEDEHSSPKSEALTFTDSKKKLKTRSVSYRPYKLKTVARPVQPKHRPKPTPIKVTPEKSLEIGLRNFKLPSRYPERFSTYCDYKNENGVEVPLLHRDKVSRILREIHDELQPIVKKFKLFYACLSENHPTRGKAAMTSRIPLKFEDVETPVYAHYIQLRVRSRQAPNDPAQFYNKATLLAIMFHEMAHILHMNHGKGFMLLLRDIFAYASRLGMIPKQEKHQLPSCRDWEKLIFEKRGKVADDELALMFD